MLKWKLMITTLPVPVAAIIVRLVLEHFFKNYLNNYSGVMDFSALAPVLTGGVFLIGRSERRRSSRGDGLFMIPVQRWLR